MWSFLVCEMPINRNGEVKNKYNEEINSGSNRAGCAGGGGSGGHRLDWGD
jgi:hypothetical protein